MKVSHSRSLLPILLTFVALTSAKGADEPPTWSREFATSLEKSVFATINAGAQLFNQGDPAGCYRVFQGSLIALGPLVKAQSEEYGATIESALVQVEAIPGFPEKALALRSTLDRLLLAARKRPAPRPTPPPEPAPREVAVLNPKPVTPAPPPPPVIPPATVAPAPKPERPSMPADKPVEAPVVKPVVEVEKPKVITEPPKPPPGRPAPLPSLWTRLGGEDRIKELVHDFLFKAMNDPRVNFDRGGKFTLDDRAVLRLEVRLIQFLSSKTGGTLVYFGDPMKKSHETMAIKGSEFDAMVEDLEDVLVVHKINEAEIRDLLKVVRELRSEIVSVN